VSSWEVASVAGGAAAAAVVTLVLMVLLARLVAAVGRLDQATRELGRGVAELRAEAEPLGVGGMVGSAGSAARSNGDGVGGADHVDNGALLSSGRADARTRLPDLALVSPVIKARALGRGTSLAARQFRQRRER
jgi:hypothetical protein